MVWRSRCWLNSRALSAPPIDLGGATSGALPARTKPTTGPEDSGALKCMTDTVGSMAQVKRRRENREEREKGRREESTNAEDVERRNVQNGEKLREKKEGMKSAESVAGL